ncbi:MAG: signal recognition particle-docking protein FtsY [bacterium]
MVKPSEKLRKGLSKTRSGLLYRVSTIFGKKKKIDEAELENLEEILIESDIGVESALKIIEDVQEEFIDNPQKGKEDLLSILKKALIEVFPSENKIREPDKNIKPHVIMIVGINGTGKTTLIGKLAYWYKNKGKKVLLGCSDTFRAAAAEQLSIWSKNAGVDLIQQVSGADPASVAYDAMDAAIARKKDILIIDTAGRLQNKKGLMEELKKIHRVIGKRMQGAPQEVLLVLDATTGQNGISQAKVFTEAVGVTDIALTKLDGTAKGGIVVAIQKKLNIPIKWVGVGETIEDLVEFNAEEFVNGLLEAH